LYSGQLEKRQAAVLGAMASDHCPIIAELAFK
jgi:endonuclease/exonuclease/phosphatase family metal-dependent hydrolase